MASMLRNILFLAGTTHAFWRMSCGVIQTGRVDPIVNPGALAAHAHTIVGAFNVGVNATFDTLLNSECTSCEITPDKSAYWTPNLYYQRPNGTFEEVYHTGSVIYYLGRGYTPDGKQQFVPFPKGFKMVSGNKAVRKYNATGMTWGNATYYSKPIADAVTFACLSVPLGPETPNMVNVPSCVNGLRAQIHFQSCWDGKNLYKTDNSHVAYLSGIDNGVCPPGYPVLLPHIFMETLYSVSLLANTSDGGRFVFSQGDPTGYGFHGDFQNGWDVAVQKNAVANCISDTGFGTVEECPILQANRDVSAEINCPERPPQVREPARGLLNKLPGCVVVTPGPNPATPADLECAASVTKASIVSTVNSTPLPTANPAIGSKFGNVNQTYLGCGNDTYGSITRTLNAHMIATNNMTVKYCQSYCTGKGYRYSGVEVNGCWCDHAVSPYTKFYQGLNFSTGCSILCQGDRTQTCGGPFYMNVYNNTNANFISNTEYTNSNLQLTAPIAPFAPGYVSCMSEPINGRALNATSLTQANMTVEICASFCSGYKYYGVEYSSQCFCGLAPIASSKVVDASLKGSPFSPCNYRCTGNFSQICGGAGTISVYLNKNYTPVVIPPFSGSYSNKGCLADTGSGSRALDGAVLKDDSMSVDVCASFCKSGKYKYFGVEYGRECYCAKSLKPGAKVTACPPAGNLLLCPGNKKQYCGAGNLLELYYSSNP